MSRPSIEELKRRVDGWDKPGTRPGYDRPRPREAVARATDPQTSWDAARSLGDTSEAQADVLDVVMSEGPLTDRELVDVYDDYVERGLVKRQSRSGIRTRRKELVEMDLVRETGEKKLPSGRTGTVWAATEKVW